MHHAPLTSPRHKNVGPRLACPPAAKRFQIPHDGAIVYYLHLRETEEIKIGTTSQWETRIYGLMEQYGTLTLIATEPGYRDREREVHQRFRLDRVHPSREVFRPSPELMGYVASLNDGEDPIVYRALPPWIRDVMTTSFAMDVPDNRPRPTPEQLDEWRDLLM